MNEGIIDESDSCDGKYFRLETMTAQDKCPHRFSQSARCNNLELNAHISTITPEIEAGAGSRTGPSSSRTLK
uniref:Uncharacterized protein n=1 Tax=Ascaris lumbricoides TaxID=6252 RepID=A0A0M3IIL9_ASCLU